MSQEAARVARDRLDGWVREVVAWHFDPRTGTPFWLEWAARERFDPREVQGYDDLRRLGNFQDEWLRGGPVQRWVPKGYAGRPVYVFETGGTALDVWSLDKTLRIADARVGEPVLARLTARYAERPAPFDLERLLARLGVRRRGVGEDVDFDDQAPLAAVRKTRRASVPPLCRLKRSTNSEPMRRRRRPATGTSFISRLITNPKRGGSAAHMTTPSR